MKSTVGQKFNAGGSIGPGPGSYAVNVNNLAKKKKKLGKFGKGKRKTAFDKVNKDTYNFKEMKRKKLEDL